MMKKNIFKFLLVSVTILLILACTKENTIDTHTSKISLDWAGYYQGVTPKYDNQGVYTDLELRDDLTFTKRTKRLGQEKKLTSISGTFSWSSDGNSIVLESDFEAKNSILSVQENRLVWQNIQGIEIGESERENYVLTKIPGILMEREWVIKKMSDDFINIVPKGENDHIYIFFDGDENKVYGFGGCNFFHASYHLVDNEIAFTPILSTKMAGPNINIENRFFNILRETRKYEIVGNELYFINDKGLHLMLAVTKDKK